MAEQPKTDLKPPKGCVPGKCNIVDLCCEQETGYLPPCSIQKGRDAKVAAQAIERRPECEKYPQCTEECNIFWGCSQRAKKEERGRVLKELREKYIENNNGPCPELADKYNHGCDAEYCGICILDETLKSLRQPKEQLK